MCVDDINSDLFTLHHVPHSETYVVRTKFAATPTMLAGMALLGHERLVCPAKQQLDVSLDVGLVHLPA